MADQKAKKRKVDHDEKQSSDPEITLHPKVIPIKKEIIENRRVFHRHPELAFEEVKTAKIVAELLESYGIEVFREVGVTGVVGVLRGTGKYEKPGKVIALRADMDALPIQEEDSERNKEYKSQIPGKSHACGHDGHVAMLLGVAKILSQSKDRIKGIVKFVFQPAEEGRAGAKKMIEAGVLDGKVGPAVDQIYALHLWNYAPYGQVCVRNGPIMAASDRFDVTIKGQGGHGAVPDGTADAILAASHLIAMFHTIVSRSISPLESGVVSVGTVNGGCSYNVISDAASFSGTVRSFSPKVQSIIEKRMEELCEGASKAFGVEAKLKYTRGYPCTVNKDDAAVERVKAAAKKVVGEQGLAESATTMCSEDFSFYLQQRPGCFFFIASSPANEDLPHHKPTFDIDERALLVGASTMLHLVEDLLF